MRFSRVTSSTAAKRRSPFPKGEGYWPHLQPFSHLSAAEVRYYTADRAHRMPQKNFNFPHSGSNINFIPKEYQ